MDTSIAASKPMQTIPVKAPSFIGWSSSIPAPSFRSCLKCCGGSAELSIVRN